MLPLLGKPLFSIPRVEIDIKLQSMIVDPVNRVLRDPKVKVKMKCIYSDHEFKSDEPCLEFQRKEVKRGIVWVNLKDGSELDMATFMFFEQWHEREISRRYKELWNPNNW